MHGAIGRTVHELLYPGRFRIRNLLWCSLSDHLAARNQIDVIGDRRGLMHIMGHNDAGQA